MNQTSPAKQHLFSDIVSKHFNFSSISTKKNQHVETLRGLAIILVVFGHIIGYTRDGGMKVSDDSIFRYLYFSLEYIRMPLFTVISGWVYANKPILNLDRGKFITGKMRRLLLPMFVVSTLLFLFRMIIPGTNTTPEISQLGNNLIFPYDVYWYLYSLFLIFLAISVLDTQSFFHKLEGWATTVASAFLLLFISKTFFDPLPNLFSFKGAIYLFPFFLIGMGIYRFNEILLNRKAILPLVIVFAIGIFIQQLIWFGYFPDQQKHSVLGITVSVSAVLLLFHLKFKNNLLVWIGNYAYGIFLFHVFFTGGTRIVLLKLGIENLWVILIISMFTSILLPIVAEIVISQFKFLKLCLLGQKDKPAKKASTTASGDPAQDYNSGLSSVPK